MTEELKKNLDQIKGLIDYWNDKKIATEDDFLDQIRPVILKIKEEIEKPSGEQPKVV